MKKNWVLSWSFVSIIINENEPISNVIWWHHDDWIFFHMQMDIYKAWLHSHVVTSAETPEQLEQRIYHILINYYSCDIFNLTHLADIIIKLKKMSSPTSILFCVKLFQLLSSKHLNGPVWLVPIWLSRVI